MAGKRLGSSNSISKNIRNRIRTCSPPAVKEAPPVVEPFPPAGQGIYTVPYGPKTWPLVCGGRE